MAGRAAVTLLCGPTLSRKGSNSETGFLTLSVVLGCMDTIRGPISPLRLYHNRVSICIIFWRNTFIFVRFLNWDMGSRKH